MTVPQLSRLGWYARRVARMSPAEVAWRARDQAVQLAWSRRQVQPRAASRRPCRHGRASAGSPPCCPAVPPAGCPRRPGRPCWPRRTGSCGGSGRCWAWPGPTWSRPTGSATRSPGAGPRRTATPSGSTTAPKSRSATSSRSGRSPGCSTSRCWPRPGSSPATSRTPAGSRDQLRSWWRENPFLSGVHWTSGIEVGIRLISLAWIRRLLDGWPGVAGLFEDDELAVQQIRWHQQYLAGFRSRGSSANNHVIAEAAGQLVASCAFPWFARKRALAAEIRASARARAAAQHLPVGHRPRARLGLPGLRRGARAAGGGRGGGGRPSAERGDLAAALRDDRQRRRPGRRAAAGAAPG